ncbi:MAG TPA: MarR family transcriptional regulator [Pseudonocardiaceae bacterium]|jgi:DNA-binding MarR family transcriptional regulator|nr:MarR family transcriptional regulator [Pseudonocardiaceae bacterium]
MSHELTSRLGYLLKHAQDKLREMNNIALAHHGIDGRELAVLIVLATGEPASQQEAAARLGVDRTTMVALLDVLEHKGLVARTPDVHDRRRNVVELTAGGRTTLHAAVRTTDEVEREFLAPLSLRAADQFRTALRALVVTDED